MSGALVTIESSAHWYTRDGQPCHEVPNKSKGGLRPTTLKDARTLDLLPSVTTIQGVLDKPALRRWGEEQAILAALTLPRLAGESLDDFAVRVVEDRAEEPRQAADLGRKIHKAAEHWYRQNEYPADAALRHYVRAFEGWLSDNRLTVIWMERVLIGADYAGTADLLVHHPVYKYCLVDLKSTTIKFHWKPYVEWAEQGAAYAALIEEPVTISNLVFDKSNPAAGPLWHRWEPDEQLNGLEVFNCTKRIWQIRKNYVPAKAAA